MCKYAYYLDALSMHTYMVSGAWLKGLAKHTGHMLEEMSEEDLSVCMNTWAVYTHIHAYEHTYIHTCSQVLDSKVLLSIEGICLKEWEMNLNVCVNLETWAVHTYIHAHEHTHIRLRCLTLRPSLNIERACLEPWTRHTYKHTYIHGLRCLTLRALLNIEGVCLEPWTRRSHRRKCLNHC